MSSLTKWSLISAGDNDCCCLGRGGNENIPIPMENLPKKNLSCISAGDYHNVVLYKDGSVFGWGDNYNGCLGFPEEVEDVKFPTKINGHPKIIDVKCGCYFTLFLTEEKKVLIASSYNKKNLFEEITICEPAVALFGFYDPWIVGESGTIYLYDYRETKGIEKFGPFPFGIPKQIVSIKHSVLLLTTSGETYGMSKEKLQPYYFDEDTKVVCKNEDHFSLIESLRDVKIIKISGLYEHFLALSEDNKVFAWGKNDCGQLGVGDKKHRYNRFVLSTVSGNSKIVDIAAGKYHSILVDSTGHVWGFGDEEYGQTMFGYQNGPLSKVVEGAVSAYCGSRFSLVLIGKSPFPHPEAGTLNLKSYISKNENENLKEENSHLRKELLIKEEQIHQMKVENEKLKKVVQSYLQIQNQYQTLKHTNELQKSEIIKLENTIRQFKKEQMKSKYHNPTPPTASTSPASSSTSSPTTMMKMKIYSQEEISNLHKIDKIGKGSTSKVIKISREEFYALKILEFDFINDNYDNYNNYNNYENDENDENEENDKNERYFKRIESFLKEYEIMSQISHPNILKTYGICYGDEKHPPSILLEYCPTNLKQMIKKFHENEIDNLISEIISGMSYLHSRGLIHRDLKPENILIDSSKHVKICDFGLSTLLNEHTHTHTQGVGALSYMSPELLNNDVHYTEKVDIYSFGIVVYFILTRGCLPKLSIGDILRGQRIPIPKDMNSFYRNMIERCLSFSPNDRPTFSDLLNEFPTSYSNL